MRIVVRRFDILPKGRYHFSWRNEGEERYSGGKRFGRRQGEEVRQVSLEDKLRIQSRAMQAITSSKDPLVEFVPCLEQRISPMADSQLLSKNYQLLRKENQLRQVEQNQQKYASKLDLNINTNLGKKLFSEQEYSKNIAKHHLSAVAPIVGSFLRQGHNFSSKKVLMYCLEKGKIKLLKRLMSGGVLEEGRCVDGEVVDKVIECYQNDIRRNLWMVNIISYNTEIKNGMVDWQDEQTLSVKMGMYQKILYDIKGSKQINKLRLLWSFQKYYITEFNLTELVIPELKKLQFCHYNRQIQKKLSKEISYVLTSMLNQTSIVDFILNLIDLASTFDEYLKLQIFVVMVLSKLKTVEGVIDQNRQDYMNDLFKFIELNLEKEVSLTFLEELIPTVLVNEGNSYVYKINYEMCWNYWCTDQSKTKASYPWIFNQWIQNEGESLTVQYKPCEGSERYANSTVSLIKNDQVVEKKVQAKGEKDMINDLLKGNYRNVLDYFMVRYSLTGNYHICYKFMQELKKIDKTLKFKNKEEEALYKLKIANKFFFVESFTPNLNSYHFQKYKENMQVARLMNAPLDFNQEVKEVQQIQKTEEEEGFGKKLFGSNKKNRGKNNDIVDQKQDDVDPIEQEVINDLLEYGIIKNAEQLKQIQSKPEKEVRQYFNEIQKQYEKVIQSQLSEIGYNFEDKDEVNKERVDKIVVEDQKEEIQPFFDDVNVVQKRVDEDINQIELDKARLDRSLKNAVKLQFIANMGYRSKYFSKKDKISQEDLQTIEFKEELYYIKGLIQNSSQISIEESIGILEELGQIQAEYHSIKTSGKNDNVKNKEYISHHKKGSSYSSRNNYSFCTVQPVVVNEGEGVVADENLFDFDKIERYRSQIVSEQFFNAMSSESNIPKIGQGMKVAKYLFLHNKREQKKMVISEEKHMTIQFTSAIGTRIKSYEPYLVSTLYPYELPSNFYQSLLEDQLFSYNRHNFKKIMAHLIYFKEEWSDNVVALFCQICRKYRIGYTFEEIAYFIKANRIVISERGLEEMTNIWFRFDIVNENMLPFIREYCKQRELPFKTGYYRQYCVNLIKDKKFDKLEELCQVVLAEIKPRTFKLVGNASPEQAAEMEKEWKEKSQLFYQSLYLELLEVITLSINKTVPQFLLNLYIDYLKMRPEPEQRELAYGFVCCSTNRHRFESLLGYLQKNQKNTTEFMFECLMKALLSNMKNLQEYIERIFDVNVLKNRLILSQQKILQVLYLFKNTNRYFIYLFSTNTFSKFLEHCLRFQVEAGTSGQIKKDMFWILNNKVDDTSNQGILSLLDFIFNEKREEERQIYRKLRNDEEEKEKKLAKIQNKEVKSDEGRVKETKEDDIEVPKVTISSQDAAIIEEKKAKQSKQKISKKQITQERKRKLLKKNQMATLASDLVAEMEEPVKDGDINQYEDDKDLVQLIKVQGKKHHSSRRQGIRTFGELYRGAIEMEKMAEQDKDEKGGKGKKGKK